MPTPIVRLVARGLLRVSPLALLVLCMACEASSPRTIGSYCRRDLDCVSGLRCLDFACTERRTPDAGHGVLDQGSVDQGAVDQSLVDLGARDLGHTDVGVDTGPEDMGSDPGPDDTGVDAGSEDLGADAG